VAWRCRERTLIAVAIGIYTFGDLRPDPVTGATVTGAERMAQMEAPMSLEATPIRTGRRITHSAVTSPQ
jgi:hypothetical protein